MKNSKVNFFLTHNYSGYPVIREMRRLVYEGIIGKISSIDAYKNNKYQQYSRNFVNYSEEFSGSFIGVFFKTIKTISKIKMISQVK